ncbi:MAG: hypothetical protein ACLQPD_01670 [Desulfomonilaceae bacterium]
MEETLAHKLYFPPSLKMILSIIPVVFISIAAIILVGPALFRDWAGPPWFAGLLFLAILGVNALWVLSIPHKIMLHRDGMVEFRSVLRSRTVPVRDIKSIKPEGTTAGSLVVI